LRCPPGVKQNAAQQNNYILILFVCQVINQKEQRQEVENKCNTAENHGGKIEMFSKMPKKIIAPDAIVC
jgi:hypothetical protein